MNQLSLQTSFRITPDRPETITPTSQIQIQAIHIPEPIHTKRQRPTDPVRPLKDRSYASLFWRKKKGVSSRALPRLRYNVRRSGFTLHTRVWKKRKEALQRIGGREPVRRSVRRRPNVFEFKFVGSIRRGLRAIEALRERGTLV